MSDGTGLGVEAVLGVWVICRDCDDPKSDGT